MYVPQIWVGDEFSYQQLVLAMRQGVVSQEALAKFSILDDDDDEESREDSLHNSLVDSVYQKVGGVGIINVAGSLVSEESFWQMFSGVTAYPTLSGALKRALEDEEVHTILQAVSTNGGAAEGLETYTDNVAVAKAVKPVYSWTGTMAHSAGYWIMAMGKKAWGTKMSSSGSIGAVITVTSISRMLKEQGIDVYVSRGGKHKALAHLAEPLSEEAKKRVDKQTEQLHGFFVEHVAQQRPQLSLDNREQWGEGDTFFGQEALQLGLLDGLMGLNEVIEKLDSAGQAESSTAGASGAHFSSEQESSMARQVVLDAAAKARVASGVPLEQENHQVVDSGAPVVPPAVPAEGAGVAAAAPAEGATLQPGSADAAALAAQLAGDAPGAPAGEAAPASTDLVSFLKETLATSQEEAQGLRQELATATAAQQQAETDATAMRPLLIDAMHRLQIGLSQPAADMSALPNSALISQYQAVVTQFNATFKVGQTSVDPDAAQPVSADETARRLGITVKS